MLTFLKRNGTVLLALLLPVLLVGGFAIATYAPSFFFTTKYNFLYITCGGSQYYYNCSEMIRNQYVIENDKLTYHPLDITVDTDKNEVPDVKEAPHVHIFFHDTEKNESREITLQKAQSMTLSGLLTSPEGVTVSGRSSRTSGEFSIFVGRSSYDFYLTKGNRRSRLNLVNNTNYYYNQNFSFLGWVLPGRP